MKITKPYKRGRLFVKRGQALVEFVIILPIFIMLVLGVIDIGNILYSKITLEEQMSDIVDYYQSGKTKEEIQKKMNFTKHYELTIEEDAEYVHLELVKKVDIITPGLQFVFDNPYSIVIQRSILNE